MYKVILKTALKTFLAVLILALIAFGIASLGFPSDMAGLCERTGNYNMATGYAFLSYGYSGNSSDLNRCFIDSVYAGNDGNIVKHGDKLIALDDFDEICDGNGKALNVDYRQFVYGKLACAKYRRGSVDEALALTDAVSEDMQGFPVNNALAVLSLEVISKGDGETAEKILGRLVKFTPATGGSEYYSALRTQLEKVGGKE